jgi:vesicle-fusing ATPase
MEKLKVSRSDFLNALENDIKPAFGTSQELLQMMLTRGIINWGSPVSHILEDGMLLIQQVRQRQSYNTTALYRILSTFITYIPVVVVLGQES